MTHEITMNERGVLTIPAPLRRQLGLRGNDRLKIEATSRGLLLQPVVSIPIEMYTDERIAEFTEDEEEVGQLLDELDGKAASAVSATSTAS